MTEAILPRCERCGGREWTPVLESPFEDGVRNPDAAVREELDAALKVGTDGQGRVADNLNSDTGGGFG